MKAFSEEAMAAIVAGTAISSGAAHIGCDPEVAVWGGYGVLPLGVVDHLGVGDKGIASVSSGALGGAEQAITLTLAGVEPDIVALLDAGALRGAPVVLRRLIFDGSGTQLLDHHVFTRGRIDLVTVRETIGGTAEIELAVESAARGLSRAGGRMRTDADQRLIKAIDGGMRKVSYAGEIKLYWGGPVPSTAGKALG